MVSSGREKKVGTDVEGLGRSESEGVCRVRGQLGEVSPRVTAGGAEGGLRVSSAQNTC